MVINNAAAAWPALTKWTMDGYLESRANGKAIVYALRSMSNFFWDDAAGTNTKELSQISRSRENLRGDLFLCVPFPGALNLVPKFAHADRFVPLCAFFFVCFLCLLFCLFGMCLG